VGIGSCKVFERRGLVFYLFWLPKYLYDARGFDIKAVGTFAWIPSAAAGVGCLLGGGFSSYLLRRRFSLGVARKVTLGISAALMPFVILIPHVAVSWAIALFCVAYFGQQSWSTLVMVLPTDLFPQEVVGFSRWFGWFWRSHGWHRVWRSRRLPSGSRSRLQHGFRAAGTLHIIAFLIILIAIPVLSPLKLAPQLNYEGAS